VKKFSSAIIASLALGLCAPSAAFAQPGRVANIYTVVRHKTVQLGDTSIFYREAGDPRSPTILLLHGFPSSSRMFRNLMRDLSNRYHLVAPDYPGFGHSPAPSGPHANFASYAKLVEALTEQLGIERYSIYVQDYGAPVGLRVALAHPDRITALIVQNGNAYEEGLGPFWDPLRAYWANPSPANRNALRAGLTEAATRSQYVDGVDDPSRIDPDNWLVDQALLDRPGTDELMLDLFYDYRTNVALYPRFQQFFLERQPPALILWGVNDAIFPAQGARAYLRDLPRAELHLLQSGHFALEDRGEEIAGLIRRFLDQRLVPQAGK
jgi:pimeloyl-ACP methyl ester carboxylesterase